MPPVVRPNSEPSNAGNAHWTRQNVKYSPSDGRKTVTREGLVYGCWAVVRNDAGTYDLHHVRTDVPTVLRIRTEEDACRIGDFLWKRFPLILRLTTVEEMRERMVPELRTAARLWVRSCEDAGKYLPPNF